MSDSSKQYSNIYSYLSPVVVAALRTGAGLSYELSSMTYNSSIHKLDSPTKYLGPGFYAVIFDKINFKVSGYDDSFNLNPMPNIIDDNIAFAIFHTNHYDVVQYRVKSPDSIAHKLWMRLSVENDLELPQKLSSNQFEFDEANYRFLLNNEEISAENKSDLEALRKSIIDLIDYESISRNSIINYNNITDEEKLQKNIDDFVSNVNNIKELHEQRRANTFLDTSFWAGDSWSYLPSPIIALDDVSLLNKLYSKNPKKSSEFLTLGYNYLKLLFETQHNLLFETPLIYLYSATKELEFADYYPSDKFQHFVKMAVNYDNHCFSLARTTLNKYHSKDFKLISELSSFILKRSELIHTAQDVLHELNKSSNATHYAKARRLLSLYIMRLCWTDNKKEKQFLTSFKNLIKNVDDELKSNLDLQIPIYLNSLSLMRTKIDKFFKELGENSSGGKSHYKTKRNEIFSTLDKLSDKFNDLGATIYAMHTKEFINHLKSHIQYKIGPQSYSEKDIFSSWSILHSFYYSSDFKPTKESVSLNMVRKELERKISSAVNLINKLAGANSDYLFFKNDPAAYHIDKYPTDLFPPPGQIAPHKKLISNVTIEMDQSNIFAVTYSDDIKQSFSFDYTNLRNGVHRELESNYSTIRYPSSVSVFGPIVDDLFDIILQSFDSLVQTNEIKDIIHFFDYVELFSPEKKSIEKKLSSGHLNQYALALYLNAPDYHMGINLISAKQTYPIKPELLEVNPWPAENLIFNLTNEENGAPYIDPLKKTIVDTRLGIESSEISAVQTNEVIRHRVDAYSSLTLKVANIVMTNMAKEIMRKNNIRLNNPLASKANLSKL